jgi:uncharacterized protein
MVKSYKFSELLKVFIEKTNLTLPELEARSGVSAAHIDYWLSESDYPQDWQSLARVGVALKMSLEEVNSLLSLTNLNQISSSEYDALASKPRISFPESDALASKPRIITDWSRYGGGGGGFDCACSSDCACESVYSRDMSSSRVNRNDTLCIHPLLQQVDISDEYSVVYAPSASQVSVLNAEALQLLHRFDTPQLPSQVNPGVYELVQQLYQLGLLYQSQDQILQPPERSPTQLAAWLHITDRCNLRCAYCYLPHSPLDMSEETGRAVVDATFRAAIAHDYRHVLLKYSGGEAMLRIEFVIRLHRYAQHIAQAHGIQLDGILLSNGTLLTSTHVQYLLANDIRLMISLDELGQSHTSQRTYVDGRDSSTDALHAIDRAIDHKLVPEISITVSGRNISSLPETVSWILERDLPFSINFYRQSSLSSYHSDLDLEEEKLVSGMQATYRVIEANLPNRSLLASLGDRANLSSPHQHTCGVGRNYLVFDHNGQIAKCQMLMDSPVVAEDASDVLLSVRNDTGGIHSIAVDDKEGCCSCEWRYWCAGGCPLETYRATGRYDVRSPYCNIYKALFPEVVRLEGLRLLKYNSGVGRPSQNERGS